MAEKCVLYTHDTTIGNFKVLPVSCLDKSSIQHHLYYKQHQVREHGEKPTDTTLFVIGVPSYCTKVHLRKLFSRFGSVQQVYCHQKPTSQPKQNKKILHSDHSATGFKVAYVVFKKPSSTAEALNPSPQEARVLQTTKTPFHVGIQKWSQSYAASIPEQRIVEKQTDMFLQRYQQSLIEAQNKTRETGPDEEGWITVTKRSKIPTISRTDANLQKIAREEKKKRATKELVNFYTFQIRESKMQHIAGLRKKFEEDKQRIALMRSARKFKPY